MALILSLETSASTCSVALHEKKTIVKTLEIHESQAHAAKLAILIDQIFKETDNKINQLNAVAISSGPGSYTGLRIGTSVAKGICYALNIPLITVETLELLTFQFNLSYTKAGLRCPMIDARRMEVYCKVFNQNLETILPVEAKIIDENSFRELLDTNKVFFFGDGSGKCKTMIQHPNASFAENIFPQASALGMFAFEKFDKSQFEDVEKFRPFYLKEFVAKKAQALI
jgi:tRNA threonylcarbamoyladenosine biosynthesis protein TsaB